MQQCMQQSQCQHILADKCITLAHHFDGTNPSTARNCWTALEKYVASKTKHDNLSPLEKIKNILLTLTDIAWNWSESMLNGIQNMTSQRKIP